MIKKINAPILGLAMSLCIPMVAMAGEWKKDQVGWWYRNDDGSYPAGKWMQDKDGKWYFFDKNGYMLADTHSPDGYWLAKSGEYTPGVSFRLTSYDFVVLGGNKSVTIKDGRYYLRSFEDESTLGVYFDKRTLVAPDRGTDAMPAYKPGINGADWLYALYSDESETVSGVYDMEVKDGHVEKVYGLYWWD